MSKSNELYLSELEKSNGLIERLLEPLKEIVELRQHGYATQPSWLIKAKAAIKEAEGK